MPPIRFDPDSSSQRRAIERDWRILCEDIGERRAGTAAELRAARFIAEQLGAAGLAGVGLEPFPCTSLRTAAAEVSVRQGRGWKRVPAAALVGAPSTPRGRMIEGELAWLELPEESHRLRPGVWRGRILALFGPLPTALSVHRRLIAAQPAAVIHVDERLPFPWVKNDGVYPYWSRCHGMPPTLTVPYTAAWQWRRDGVARVRVRVAVNQVPALSHNVVAELPGLDPSRPALVVTAHHDTQCGNVGADDNASGVVCLLALARALAARRRCRTIRFVSFGTEEQLSVGATAYVERHQITAADTGLVVNFDSVASPLGHYLMSVAGGGALERHARRRLAAHGVDVQARREITPFADQFPFNRAGVPSLLFMRPNFPGGRWQHHSRHDDLKNVSAGMVLRLLRATFPLIDQLAARTRWPFSPRLPAAQQTVARRLGRELFGP